MGDWVILGDWRWAIGDWWGDGRLDMGCCWILTIYIQQLKSTSFEGYVLHKNHARVACYKNIKKSVVIFKTIIVNLIVNSCQFKDSFCFAL